jgi:hypothetical protein
MVLIFEIAFLHSSSMPTKLEQRRSLQRSFWTISTDDADGGMIQRLRWWHVEGEHHIKITGVQRRQNMMLGKEEEEGYLDQCQQSKCTVM